MVNMALNSASCLGMPELSGFDKAYFLPSFLGGIISYKIIKTIINASKHCFSNVNSEIEKNKGVKIVWAKYFVINNGGKRSKIG